MQGMQLYLWNLGSLWLLFGFVHMGLLRHHFRKRYPRLRIPHRAYPITVIAWPVVSYGLVSGELDPSICEGD